MPWMDFPHIKMSQYFPKPLRCFGRNINVKGDLSSYATKADIENITHIDTWNFSLKTNLASLKTEVDQLDNDKLVPVPVDLGKLYHKLAVKVSNTDTSELVLKLNIKQAKQN